LINLGIKS